MSAQYKDQHRNQTHKPLMHKWVDGQLEGTEVGTTDEKVVETSVGMQDMTCV